MAEQTALARIEGAIDKDVTGEMRIGGKGITFANAGEMMEFAKMMAVGGHAIPPHLRGKPGACLAIVDDSIRFGIAPFALARKAYFVNDQLAYEAQVISAIMLIAAPFVQRPDVAYEGEGDMRQCIVTATFRDGKTQTLTTPPIKQIHPKNSPLWKSDPDQQLAYYGLRAFGRRFCPDVIMGAYDVDEAQTMKNVTPAGSGVRGRLAKAAKKGKASTTGFQPSGINEAIGAAKPPARKPYAVPPAAIGEPPNEGEAPERGVPAEIAIEPQGGDPEVERAGAQAFVDGEERRAPEDFNPEQCADWLNGYDAMLQRAKGLHGR